MQSYIYSDLLQALKGEPLSSVFSSDGTLTSASAAPHCGGTWEKPYASQAGSHKKMYTYVCYLLQFFFFFTLVLYRFDVVDFAVSV